MFEPTELDTAMSPRPFRATITLVIRYYIKKPSVQMSSLKLQMHCAATLRGTCEHLVGAGQRPGGRVPRCMFAVVTAESI
ncbi:hypothetical protein EYF80_025395 [Liparis tanakae]|uniref:Uncharacterized protein n=1 Tax=Liparis tanakae TaxID=230148 RepID=A0A4Z2HHI1_9TELE|nr:hypothetical protein EYF80_025395 [Liparis tanakae]